ncbi:CPBP family intramembrane glutamic endopeptidase [Halosimplex marinum]|uniref:CPBP family intramembrane glutamic endopeptidase n=1 Tax=Halosimplex marinum TaxID=3396620 RepID=UPI003F57F95A
MTLSPAVGPALQTAPETDLAGFAWLVAAVLAGFLILARLSQGVVDGDGDDEAADPKQPRPSGRSGFDGRDPAAGERGPNAAERDPNATGRDAAGNSDGDEAGDAPGSSPVAHPLAPDGAVGPTEDADRPGAAEADRVREPLEPAVAHNAREGPAMSPGVLLLNVALTQGLFGAILAGGAWYFGVPLDALGVSGDPLSTGLPAVAVGVAFGVVLWVGNELASGLAAASGADYDEGLRELLAPEGVRGWGLLLGATLPTIAVVEEFIFRAAVVGAVTPALDASPWLLAVVSSVAFALGHGAQGRVGVLVTGGLGFALAAGFVLTESLLVVVVAHYLVNALEFLVHEGLGLPDPVWS